jgi:hypothetical protein
MLFNRYRSTVSPREDGSQPADCGWLARWHLVARGSANQSTVTVEET